MAFGMGLLGRAMSLSRDRPRRLGWNLLWELPIALGLGLFGLAVGEHFNLGPWETNAASIVIGYLGPPIVDDLVRRWIPGRR